MLKLNLLLALRSFRRNQSTFLINLIGLATGITSALLIFIWVDSELKVDKFHENDDRLYQVVTNQHLENEIQTWTGTPDLLAEALAEEIPAVESATSVMPGVFMGFFTLSPDSGEKTKTYGNFAEKNFFNLFNFPLLYGDPSQVLEDKKSIVLSEKLARQMFDDPENALGQTINWEMMGYQESAIVSGIFKDVPAHSTEDFDFVLSFPAWLELSESVGRRIYWGNYGPRTYVLIDEDTPIEDFNDKIVNFLTQKDPDLDATLMAVPYSSLYLYGNFENGAQQPGRILYVNLLSVVAVFILLIACINFMNLSTARASRRIKEIGIKKTVGAGKNTLILQFLSESIILSLAALVVAILCAVLLLPQFNSLTGKLLTLDFPIKTWIILVTLTVFTGLFAGSYPAFYLSSFKPSIILSRNAKIWSGEVWLRKGLVVFQFSLSIILIIGVIIVYRQLDFIQTKNLGYNKENVIYFNKTGALIKKEDVFIEEIKKLPEVVNASSSVSSFMGTHNSTLGVTWPGKDPENNLNFEVIIGNYDLLETMQIKVNSGRSFSRSFAGDQEKVIFNQAAIKMMGLDDPLGETVTFWGEEKQIIGIVDNFHFESLYEDIRPAIIVLDPEKTFKIMARIQGGKEKEALAKIEGIYQELNPGYAFEYRFLNHDYQLLYASEQRLSSLSKYFAALAILISCLGLFGLATYSVERRIKEIGIRKVLGSSAFGIVRLLSSDFTKMVILAIILAWPISYLLGQSWLNDFAFKIELQWWFFVLAGVVALLIAWLTVGIRTFKAAITKPTNCLKEE